MKKDMDITNRHQCSNGAYEELISGTNTDYLSAEEFVKNLLEEGSRVPCDETCTDFNKNELPSFYDPVKFRRAQKFFKKHIFALYVSKLLGLIITLASPSVLTILQMTKMSGCIMTSFRRYVATMLHMNIWYENDLTEYSRVMQSIRTVKGLHNSASKQARSKGMPPITQVDMALTQFGFMGLTISRTEMIGIHNASQEELESMIHFWRVIGYLMGIQDRFNLCGTSLKETRQVCEILMTQVFKPLCEDKNEEFLKMTSYLINGMWHMNPFLHHRIYLSLLYEILKSKSSNNNTEETPENHQKTYLDLKFYEKLYLNFIAYVLSIMNFTILRVFLNWMQVSSIWIVEHFPYLAVYRFGYRNSIVSIKLSNLKPHTS